MIKITLILLLLAASLSADSSGFWWHKFVSGKADTSDAAFIMPSDWNTWHRPYPESSVFISDEFFGPVTTTNTGQLVWWAALAGTAVGQIAGQANHPGIDTLNNGATDDVSALIILTLGTTFTGHVLATDFFDITWIVKLAQTDAQTTMRVGLTNGTVAQPVTGIYIEKDSVTNGTEWRGVCRNAGTQTKTASSLGTTDTNWHRFRIRLLDYTTDSVAFSIDGGTELKVGTNKPTIALAPFASIGKNGTTTKTMYLDYFSLRVPVSR